MKSFKKIVLNYILLNAIKKNTNSNIKRWISLGADVNVADSEKTTVLMWASQHRRITTVKLLIDAGANVNHTNLDTWTALAFAVIKSDRYISIMLINALANVNHITIGSSSILIFAASMSDDDIIIDALIKAGANVNYYDYDMRNALMAAARNGHTHNVKRLMATPNINVNAIDALYRRSALAMSIYNGHISTVQTLLDHPCIHPSVVALNEADINQSPNRTLIQLLINQWHLKQSVCYAAAGTHIRNLSIEAALARGNLSPEEISRTRDWNGYTSLTNSIKSGNLKGLHKLLEAGASLLVAGDLQGTSIGAYAILYGHVVLGEQLYYKTLKAFCRDRPAFKRMRSEIVIRNGFNLPRELVNYILEFVIKIELPPGF